jgi:hypothetical protein
MAYHFFLKSLRSLEEFRKNSHVKIPPKSPSTNVQSLGKFKNPIFNLEILFPCFRSSRLPLASLLSRVESNPVGPASQHVDGAFEEVRFPFWFTPSRAGLLSLIPLTSGPRLSAPSPNSSRPSSPAPPQIPSYRAPPSSALQVPPRRYEVVFVSPPLISFLNPPPSSMALKPLTLALTAPATPPRCSPGPYKRQAPPPSSTTPSPASFPLSPRLSSVLTERRRLPVLHHRRPASTAPPELW